MGTCCSWRIHITAFPQLWYRVQHNWIFRRGDNYFQVFCQLFSKVLFKILYTTTGTISPNQSEHTATHWKQTLAINNQHSNVDWISPGYAGILIKRRNHLPSFKVHLSKQKGIKIHLRLPTLIFFSLNTMICEEPFSVVDRRQKLNWDWKRC